MPVAYYNEIDSYAAQWLRNLIAAGLIARGIVDERSIEDVRPDELRGYAQCHFFAGIGGWSHALRLAGWPDDQPVWTGSCPCQPFSVAGKGAGFADQRHLWPAWFHLIRECRPAIVFGEQVASAAVGPWLDLVQADVESVEFAFGSVAFPAAGVSAPHIRDRTYWVANASGTGLAQRQRHTGISSKPPGTNARQAAERDGVRAADWMANAHGGHAGPEREQRGGEQRQQSAHGRALHLARPGALHGFWDGADWLLCRDGRWRPVEPGTFPLAHGLSGRVGQLRAYGNAIVPQAAAEVIGAYMDCRP